MENRDYLEEMALRGENTAHVVKRNPFAIVLMGVGKPGINGVATREGFLAETVASGVEAYASLGNYPIESFSADNRIDRHGRIERLRGDDEKWVRGAGAFHHRRRGGREVLVIGLLRPSIE